MKVFCYPAAAAFCLLAPATAGATNFAILLGGISGESNDPATPGAVVVEAFEIDGPLFTGKPGEFSLRKRIDKATPLLMKACATGKHIAKAVLTGRRAAADGGGGGLMRIELKEVFVTGIRQNKPEGQADPDEIVQLKFASIFYRYYPASQSPSTAAFMSLADSGPDTDRDGMSDAFESFFRLNPALNDAAGDLDGDGLSNGDESRLGYNPAAGDSFFSCAATPVPGVGDVVDLSWEAIPGKSYVIEWSADPESPFKVLSTVIPTESTGSARVTRTGLTGFYRVRPGAN